MSAILTLDQAGLPAGTPNQARDDGLSTGAIMSATASGYISTFRMELLWVALHGVPDTTSEVSFAPSAATVYSWTPTVGSIGSYAVRLITDEGTPEQDEVTKVISVKSSPTALRIPAPQERGDANASLELDGVDQKKASWFDKPEVSGPFAGAGGTWAPWWRPVADLIHAYNTAAAGVPATRQINTTAPLAGGGNLTADRTLSITAATTLAAGSMSSTDKAKLDGLPSSAVPTTRALTAGAGMTGGGDLSADRTFNVVANADGSIVVNADDVQVGILATNAQHGNRGGGSLHSQVTTLVDGFMIASDKSKLDGLPSSAVPTTRQVIAGAGMTGGGALSGDVTLNVIANADGSIVVAADDVKVGVLATDAQHGNRGGGGIHSNAVAGGAAGFLSGTDKTKLDELSPELVYVTASGTTKTLALSDRQTIQRCTNAAGITITIPTNASVAFNVGTGVGYDQEGAAQITIAGAGITFQSSGSEQKSARQLARIWTDKKLTDTWVVTGEKTT